MGSPTEVMSAQGQGPQARPHQCQYCERKFARLEHRQRHERTHTKESPYKCTLPACGKAFPRGDLLRRHEKSVHHIDARRKRNSIYAPPSLVSQASGSSHHVPTPSWSPTTALSNGTPIQSEPLQTGVNNSSTSGLVYGGVAANEQFPPPPLPNSLLPFAQPNAAEQAYAMETMTFDKPITDPFDVFGESDAFLENFDFSSLFLPSTFGLDPDPQIAQPVPSHSFLREPTGSQSDHLKEAHTEPSTISRFGSPLPSIRPDPKTATKQPVPRTYTFTRPVPCWKVSKSDYIAIEDSIRPLAAVLPADFVLPTRHTTSRYLEGCIRGLYEHMPLTHIATWTVRNTSPDLTLSMLAAGAQFKFEGHKVMPLFFAAKAAIYHQLRIRSQPFGTGSADGKFDTMHAILNLMVLGSWGRKQLVGEAMAFQSLLAELARADDGFASEPDCNTNTLQPDDKRTAWLKWIALERRRRISLFAYSFLNLQSVAYNVAPCIMTTELHLKTPAGQEEWSARTPEAWEAATKIQPTKIMSEYQSLFQPSTTDSTTPVPPSSSLTNYILIFAILQCIFLLRESKATLPYPGILQNTCIRADDVETLANALQRWQSRWENSPDSTIDPVSSSGPVAFNSTALLRLAWIRLHANLGPCRNLASRDPNTIVEAFKSCPPLKRHAGLAFPIVQAAHALSIPVRLGIAYVAKTQTLSWSVQHSLCNLECAIFVSKWFDTIATTISNTPLTPQEVGLIYMFRSIVQETGFFKDEAFEPAADDEGWQRLIRHLGTAVAMLWAEIFSGTHVFEMVSTIGQSLGIYAKQYEDAHTPITVNHH